MLPHQIEPLNVKAAASPFLVFKTSTDLLCSLQQKFGGEKFRNPGRGPRVDKPR